VFCKGLTAPHTSFSGTVSKLSSTPPLELRFAQFTPHTTALTNHQKRVALKLLVGKSATLSLEDTLLISNSPADIPKAKT
jgi:hypothetical protein